MKLFAKIAASLAVATALVGCAAAGNLFGSVEGSLTAADCRAADWRSTGENDAILGREDRLALYKDACDNYGVIPDPNAYARGRAEGSVKYCTAEQAYLEGRAGRALRPEACPTADISERRLAYEHGETYRKLRRELRALDDQSAGLGTPPGAGAVDSRQPLYAQPEFNPIAPRKRAELEAELRRYSSWPPAP